MKKYNNEKGTLFVQKADLLKIREFNGFINESIENKMFTISFNALKPNEYVEFTDKKEIEYLNSLSFIVDLNKLEETEDTKIISMIKEGTNIQDRLLEKAKSISNRNARHLLMTEAKKIGYTIKTMKDYIFLKKQNKKEDIITKTSRGISYVGDNKSLYVAYSDSNSNNLFIMRKDKEEIQEGETIPSEFIQTALSLATMNMTGADKFYTEDEYVTEISSDRKTMYVKRVVKEAKKTPEKKHIIFRRRTKK